MNRPIYLDYAATTPIDEAVLEKMLPFMSREGQFGNSGSSSHVYGWEAQEAVEEARSVVAELINADPSEIFWTSGATEADNLALKGICSDSQTKKHLITSSLEHKAILDCCRYLERQGHQIDYVQPNKHGTLTSAEIANVIEEGLSSVVSVMHVNNELGNINPIGDIGSLCREKGVLFHTDAAQSFGKLRIDVKEQCLDMISVSGHKIYGPKGVGFIFISKAAQKQIMPQLHGGGQEMSMRPGTLATHQIVGLSEAAKIMSSSQSVELQRLQALKRVFFDNISKLPGFFQNSHSEDHFPGIFNFGFSGVDGETLLLAASKIAVSTGSACNSEKIEASHVLRGLGLTEDHAASSIRVSFGRYTTAEDVRNASEEICTVINRLIAK